jgi:uncharacterized membrane protein
MDEDRLDVGKAVSYGWNSMKENVGFFVLVFLIFWVVEGVFYGIGGAFLKYPAITIVLYVIGWLLAIFIQMSVVNITLRLNKGGEPDFKDIYSAGPYFGKFILAAILYFLLVFAGLILCVIPGIYWGIKYHFFGYFVIEQNMDPLDALKRSGEITKGSMWNLLLLFIIFIGITFVGAILCGIGLLFSTPIVVMATVYAYRRLLETSPQVMTPAPGAPAAE